MVVLSIACSFVSSSVFVEVQDPIRLKHFGKKEILAKIDLMELEYNIPMTFDDTWIPSTPVAAGQNIREWDYGIGVFGAAHGHACMNVKLPPCWQTCVGLSQRRRLMIPRLIYGAMGTINWSR